eukprot:6202243-Pleurochrysis_carterae.AAC.3
MPPPPPAAPAALCIACSPQSARALTRAHAWMRAHTTAPARRRCACCAPESIRVCHNAQSRRLRRRRFPHGVRPDLHRRPRVPTHLERTP